MELRGLLGHAVTGLLVLFVVSMLLGQVLGQPVLLSFVETGSMAPTMEPGDGFVAIPAGLAGPIEPGDVVVFDAERLNDGGLVTHRVVDETDAGYVTKGDANPFTDQSSSEDEPPVQREQVVAVAMELGGDVLVIPKLGLLVIVTRDVLTALQTQLAGLLGTRALLGTQGLAYLLFAFGALAYVVSLLFEGDQERPLHTRARERGLTDNATVILALTAVLVAILTASMVVPSGPQQFAFVSSDSDAPGAGVIGKGESENATYRIPSNGVLPAVVFLEPTSDGIDVTPREVYVPSGEQVNATVTLHAPPQNGYYRRYVVEHRYIAILPQSTIGSLYRVHPWAPIVAIDLLVGGAFLGFAVAFVGIGRDRTNYRIRDLPLGVRIMRWLREGR